MKRGNEMALSSSDANKKVLTYVKCIRIWYLLCPLIALLFGHYNLKFALHIYEGALALFCLVCIYSQFFSGLSWGFDLEQLKLKKEAEAKAKKEWGVFYTSPLSFCLPCILVIGVIELPKAVTYLSSVL